MTIILPLEPQEEAKLIALAQEKGVTPDALVRAAINAMLAEAGNLPVLEPIHSCAVYLRNTVPRQRADVVKQLPMPEPLPDKPRIAGGFDFQAKRGFGLYRRSGVERRAYRRFGDYDRRGLYLMEKGRIRGGAHVAICVARLWMKWPFYGASRSTKGLR
jgi:hypothetical protein